jgi:nitrate reductase alpha subunit
VVLPAATWYEKADLSSTDMHPYVHAFSPATDPPWETRSDFDAFAAIARSFSAMAKRHLGTRSDVVLTALLHDTPDAMAYPDGAENVWLHTGAMPVPGKTMSKLTVVERDYGAIYDKWATLGPLADKFGLTVKGFTVHPFQEIDQLAAKFGVMNSGAGHGRPAITTANRMADVILLLSGTSNGRLAVEGFLELEKRTGQRLAYLAEGSEEKRITYADTQARPVPVITSPEWSGSETGGRRYAPFTIKTLLGRKSFGEVIVSDCGFGLHQGHPVGESTDGQLPAQPILCRHRRHILGWASPIGLNHDSPHFAESENHPWSVVTVLAAPRTFTAGRT